MVGGGVAPRYSGSKDTATSPAYGLSIRSPYGVFLDSDSGLGWGTTLPNGVSTQVYVGLSGSRKDHRKHGEGSDYLRGMGDIKSRASIGWDISAPIGPVVLSGSIRRALKQGSDKDTGKAYTQVHVGIGTDLVKGTGGTVSVLLGASFGDSNYMQTWYGVSAAQAGRTRFAAYRPKAGMESVSLGGSWSYPIDKHFSATLSVEAAQLVGDAGKSPLTQKKHQYSGGLMLGYQF
ncbi:structural protein MipA [Paludibacterium paludis]|uniref:Structural protein MipA n=2 Tax=Paludibacterium paludis TaxID=1225769 RepID=A0A918P347_9NEIS|nr:structural protein MipA [Paludibacterium paludis]